eukprot:6183237-Pleurochrysis_carterae.AAC.5
MDRCCMLAIYPASMASPIVAATHATCEVLLPTIGSVHGPAPMLAQKTPTLEPKMGSAFAAAVSHQKLNYLAPSLEHVAQHPLRRHIFQDPASIVQLQLQTSGEITCVMHHPFRQLQRFQQLPRPVRLHLEPIHNVFHAFFHCC